MLESRYEFIDKEKKWRFLWEEEGIYSYSEAENNDVYVIDTPPPTISGELHMGHFFSYCHADFIARYQRMKGKNVFYPMGFDDNGLPTERLIEKITGSKAYQLVDKNEFLDKCDLISSEYAHKYAEFFFSFGLSIDRKLFYRTSDKNCSFLSQSSFLDLLKKGLIFRGKKPCFWDCVDRTAISQAEVVEKDYDSFMYSIGLRDLQGVDSDISLAIGTTRPEMLPGCLAILYNPEDSRYLSFNNKSCSVLTAAGVRVPLLADNSVMLDKGTGLVMLCTFGDEQDVVWYSADRSINGQSFRFISYPEIIKQDGSISIPKIDTNNKIISIRTSKNIEDSNLWRVEDVGLFNSWDHCISDKKVSNARGLAAELCSNLGFLLEKKPVSRSVKCAERSGAPLEIIETPQWYLSLKDHKGAFLKKASEVIWYPEKMFTRIEQWIEGLKSDWCLSRQRFLGIKIPIWMLYLIKKGNDFEQVSPDDEDAICFFVLPDKEDLPIVPEESVPSGFVFDSKSVDSAGRVIIRATTTRSMNFLSNDLSVQIKTGEILNLYPEMDVLDTWATSSLTPNISAGGINNDFYIDKDKMRKLLPADLRPQAHEIIRTWAFYTIVKSFLHSRSIPWKNIMISGWCMASDKTKMSKSKGNIVSPEKLIAEKGADALRYWAGTGRLGSDIALSEDVIGSGSRLIKKLWNAARFSSLHIDSYSGSNVINDVNNKKIFCDIDLWLLSKLKNALHFYEKKMNEFEYSFSLQETESFFWGIFCDNYLELVKARLYGSMVDISVEEQNSAIGTLFYSFKAILGMFAPFIPFVTEEIHSYLYVAAGSIHARGSWPDKNLLMFNNKDVESKGDACVELLESVRKIKTLLGISIKKPCNVFIIKRKQDAFDAHDCLDLKRALNAEKFDITDSLSGNEESRDITSSGTYEVMVNSI